MLGSAKHTGKFLRKERGRKKDALTIFRHEEVVVFLGCHLLYVLDSVLGQGGILS